MAFVLYESTKSRPSLQSHSCCIYERTKTRRTTLVNKKENGKIRGEWYFDDKDDDHEDE